LARDGCHLIVTGAAGAERAPARRGFPFILDFLAATSAGGILLTSPGVLSERFSAPSAATPRADLSVFEPQQSRR